MVKSAQSRSVRLCATKGWILDFRFWILDCRSSAAENATFCNVREGVPILLHFSGTHCTGRSWERNATLFATWRELFASSGQNTTKDDIAIWADSFEDESQLGMAVLQLQAHKNLRDRVSLRLSTIIYVYL